MPPAATEGHQTRRVHLMILGQTADALQALQSRKSGQRLFLKQHLTASKVLAPAFDQWIPAPLNRLPTICFQALSIGI